MSYGLIEIAINCKTLINYPWPTDPNKPMSRLIETKEVWFAISKTDLQVYFKDGMFMIDKAVATKLLELITEK